MITMILITMLASIVAGIFWTETSYSDELRRKALEGDMVAQFNLALCYQTGTGIEEDMEEAQLWFSKAATQGHAEAQFILSTLFRDI